MDEFNLVTHFCNYRYQQCNVNYFENQRLTKEFNSRSFVWLQAIAKNQPV